MRVWYETEDLRTILVQRKIVTESQSFSWGNQPTQFFFDLTPDRVLEAVEASGLYCTGRCFALGSYENRVYEVEIEKNDDFPEPQSSSFYRRIVKFYRPGRWNENQIRAEHDFLNELKSQEIPAIAPIPFPGGDTLKKTNNGNLWYCLFPKVGGRAPDELSFEQLERVGRLLARIHQVGASKKESHRISINPNTYGLSSLSFLQENQLLPLEIEREYERCVKVICERSQPLFEKTSTHRIHGDCHFGNLLWNEQGPFFLDFDDMVVGPAVQDIWLLVPGRDSRSLQDRLILIEAYEQLRDFDRSSLRLIEPLRALRMIHFSAWIGKRYEDPAFPRAFPDYGSHRYWQDELQSLQEIERMIEL